MRSGSADGYKVDADSIGSRSCNAQGMTTMIWSVSLMGVFKCCEENPDDENGLIGTCSGKLDMVLHALWHVKIDHKMMVSELWATCTADGATQDSLVC